VEVKSALGGFPESLTPTLSALANHPGGGLIVLGVDESAGFRAVGLRDLQTIKQALGSKVRAYVPPVRFTIEDAVVDGVTVVAARVHECDASAKPCRVASTGAAYLRSYDGDYAMSELEAQGFMAARRPPHFDRDAVAGSSKDDLDQELVDTWSESARSRSPHGLGRFEGNDLLRRAGVLTDTGTITVAGLLALGKYPQEWFPRYVIQAAVMPSPGDPPETRVHDLAVLDGPVPRMLDGALDWARRNVGTRVVGGPDGIVRDAPDFPLEAFREIVANALIHRDLDAWSESMAVEVRLLPDRIVAKNPGGLYGVTVDRLGKESVTSARNARLLSLCQDVRSPDTGARVVEALATGLQKVTTELEAASLPPPRYLDAGIGFTVLMSRLPSVTSTNGPPDGSSAHRVLAALGNQAVTVPELERVTGLRPANIRRVLRQLRDDYGLVEQIGGPGRPTTYRRR
jgi:ATP-dependent DNA helicase RecG